MNKEEAERKESYTREKLPRSCNFLSEQRSSALPTVTFTTQIEGLWGKCHFMTLYVCFLLSQVRNPHQYLHI